MPEETISVRIASETKSALNAIAARTDRDVGRVIEDAHSVYAKLNAWQTAHI